MMICGYSKEIIIVFWILIIFSVLASPYVAYKAKNNYTGLAVFICFMMGIWWYAYVVLREIKDDFQQQVFIISIQRPFRESQDQELKTVKKWVEFYRKENQKNTKHRPF